jgi:glycine oxidase
MSWDVAVIGSGVVGLSCAWKLAQEGLRVVVVDPHPSSGASYAAAGMIAPVTEAAYGEQELAALAIRSADQWPAFAAELEDEAGLAIGYRTSGTLLVAADGSDRAVLDELYAFHRTLGLPSELVGPSRARELEPLLAPSNRGGIFAAGDAQVDNRRLLAALAEACRRRGVGACRSTAVGIAADGGRAVGVDTSEGRVTAGAVLLAAGYRSIAVGEGVGYAPPTRPVKGQILRLRTPPMSVPLSRTVRAVVGGFSVYVVARADGSVVLGATQEDVGPDERPTVGGVHGLLRDALRVVPSLSEFEITDVRAGLRPGSPDNAAIVGATPLRGLSVATGHHRNGILFAPLTTEMVRALIVDGALPGYAAPFEPSRFS